MIIADNKISLAQHRGGQHSVTDSGRENHIGATSETPAAIVRNLCGESHIELVACVRQRESTMIAAINERQWSWWIETKTVWAIPGRLGGCIRKAISERRKEAFYKRGVRMPSRKRARVGHSPNRHMVPGWKMTPQVLAKYSKPPFNKK